MMYMNGNCVVQNVGVVLVKRVIKIFRSYQRAMNFSAVLWF